MNVMIYNKYKELLTGLNIEVMKTLEGTYNVDEIIDTFTNFYYDKMILDITAIRDYQNTDNLQKLAMNINMENVILLLDDNPETDSKTYLSKLISLGIYNFTRNADGINYLLVHPHTYRDVVNIHNLNDLEVEKVEVPIASETHVMAATNPVASAPSARLRVIGFKNLTQHAGATSLIYMILKTLQNKRKITALEINKVDFVYFNNNKMTSTTSGDVLKEIMRRQGDDIVLVDLNDYDDLEICTDVYYLLEPSIIMLNRLLRRSKNILDTIRTKNVILNKCTLNSSDIATFEYETKLKILASISPVDERQTIIDPINNFIDKIGL